MNKRVLLEQLRLQTDVLVQQALTDPTYYFEVGQQEHYNDDPLDPSDIEDALRYVIGRKDNRELTLPTLSKSPAKAITSLRRHFDDDVTVISFVLHSLFPKEYLFFRVSNAQAELFDAFDFFSEVCDEFRFSFNNVSKRGVDQYLAVNQALVRFIKRSWPDEETKQCRASKFLYHGLARLFLQTNDYNRYWNCATSRDVEEDYDADVRWSARKEVQKGDLVFMHGTAPRKAITHLFRVTADASFEEYFPWGFQSPLEIIAAIPDIEFGTMRNDDVLKQWSVIKRQFQGVSTEFVPHSCYNRLLDLVPREIKRRFGLKPELLGDIPSSGIFASEAEFEDFKIEPLLRRWGLSFRRRVPCKCQFGTQDITGFVDFLISDNKGPMTLFENKAKIVTDKQLNVAIAQGKSYALMLGVASFLIGAPEGLWLYSLNRNQETEVAKWTWQDAAEEDFRRQLLKLR
jgi:hypothetical protein